MARAVASFGKKEFETAPFASLTASDVIRAPVIERSVPVDFRPLLKAHKKAGRLSLRIERLPQGAKFSAGRRGEDNSWVLASDELEDLDFLVSASVARDYQFTVRVMAFEGGEISTLKVLEFVVRAGDEAAPAQEASPQAGRDPLGQDPAPHRQTDEAQALLTAREAELTALRIALEEAESAKETEHAKARSEWEVEVHRRIAEAVEQVRAQHGQENEAREAAHKSRTAEETRKAERNAAAQEQTSAERELRSKAERQTWEAESAKRMEAARQDWQAQSEQRIAEARRKMTAEAEQAAKLRDLSQSGADQQLETARQEWRLEAARTLEAARRDWQAESEARGKAEIARVKAESEDHIAAERRKMAAEAEQAAKRRDLSQSDAAQQLEAARQAWAADADERRKAELQSWKADIEARLEAERRTGKAEAESQAKQERQRWEADAEQHLEVARRTARAESDAVLAAERTRLQAEAEQRLAAERQRLSSEYAAAEKTPEAAPPIDQETAQKLAEEKNKIRQLDAALQAAAHKNRDLETALAATTAAREQAEQALAAAPAPDEQDGYIRSLQSEIATLRQSVVDQAAELGKAHAAAEQSHPLHLVHSAHNAQNLQVGKLRNIRDEDEDGGQGKRSVMRDAMMAAAIVIPLVLLYPWIAVYLPDSVRDGIATATGGLLKVDVVQPAPRIPIQEAPSTPEIKPPLMVADRVLNVRATPATTGAVILSLPKNASVAVLGKQGNWTEIEIQAGGKPQKGWVWSAYLQTQNP
jgi:hypothetical protein